MLADERARGVATGDVNRGLRHAKNSRRHVVFFFLGCGALLGWLYLIFISDAFAISAVEVRGLKNMDPIEVSKTVYDVLDERGGGLPWPARHAWFVDRTRLASELSSRLFLANVIVDKSYGSILRLSVEERSKRVVFHSHKQYFWVDAQGVATDELTSDERLNIQSRLLGTRPIGSDEPPVIKRNLDQDVSKGSNIASLQEAREWIKLAEDVKALNLAYREIEPPQATSTLFRILSAEGRDVLMDITAPLDLQVRTYLEFVRSAPKDIGKPEYVDVRVPGRVYLK